MRKIHRRHDLLRCRISRVLIELRLGNLRYKGRGAEFRLIILQPNLFRKQAFFRQCYHHFGAHRPIRFRLQAQRAVVVPLPGAVDARVDGDARCHVFAHAREGAHRIAEFDNQRLRLGVGLIHRRGFRRGNLVRHFQRLGQFVVPHFARHATRDERNTHTDRYRRATHVRPHPARERDCAKPHRIADAAQPARRLPLNVADHRPQHAPEETGGIVAG